MDSNDEITLTGISGRYPQCRSFDEFKDALLKGVDLVTADDSRFPPGLYDTPERSGKIPDVDKFDAGFFGIHSKQADYMDARQRVLLETMYEAIVDSGYNPQELRGSKTGVYVGLGNFTSYDQVNVQNADGYSNIGICLALAANRASYCFDFKGPSFTMDTACSSSMYAFVNACKDIRSGEIDSAIVAGAQVNFNPLETMEFDRLNMLADDGKCKVFNAVRDGYARSEAVISLLLQKKSDSRRVYATVAGAKRNCDGGKVEGITYPSAEMQLDLMRDVFTSNGIDLKDVTYVEAHGTGTLTGDIVECKALMDMFCKDRKDPIPVGAVKSNMGHAEISSALCSLSKVLVAMESGVIPANLHIDSLDETLPGIKENSLKIVTENIPFKQGVVALNSFGFGGANAHVALKPNPKNKGEGYKRPKHRLVQVSGRTEEAVHHFLSGVKDGQDDEDFLTLVDEVHRMNVEGHNYRGYAVLGENTAIEIERYSKDRPIWFIYTGMGSQWSQMGRDLLKIDVFRKTFTRCAEALKPFNVDLFDIVTSEASDVFDSITNCFCAIGAMEIALTDLLYSMDIRPDNIAGHSLGEVGCSYADGQITPEQGALLAYARGYASSNAKMIPGQMAAVAMSPEECQKQLPDGVFIACRNGKSSVTISGPKDVTLKFVKELSSRGIFARAVQSAGIAFHTKYVGEAGKLLYDFVKKVLKDPKPRSSKWVSSSVPSSNEDLPWARLNCAEYHTNNFCSTVLFDQVYQHVPDNAVVVEVAPHGLLQAILKREMGPNVTNISLVNRSSEDNEKFFLSAIGKIYLSGGQPNLKNLYKGVSYPVSRGTKSLGSLVKWDHSVTWICPNWVNKDFFGEKVSVNVSDEKFSYLEGHNIDGRVLMPATGYLELVWEIVSRMLLKSHHEVPVVIENVSFKRATVLPPNQDVSFLINVMKQSGNFEIFEGGSVVVTGRIRVPKDVINEFQNPDEPKVEENSYQVLTKTDLYKECRIRRYLYSGLFQGISKCNVFGTEGRIEWNEKFTSFLDTMLHLTVVAEPARNLFLPTSIEQVIIDPVKHLELIKNNNELPIFYNKDLNIVKTGGIEIVGPEWTSAPRRQHIQADPILESYEFVYYESPNKFLFNFEVNLQASLLIVIQNLVNLIKNLNVSIVESEQSHGLDQKVKDILDKQVFLDYNLIRFDVENKEKQDLVIFAEDAIDDAKFQQVSSCLTKDGFVLYKGKLAKLKNLNLEPIFQGVYNESSLFLLKTKSVDKHLDEAVVVKVSNTNFKWLEDIKQYLNRKEVQTIFLVAQNEKISGITGLVKALLTEPSGNKFKSFFIHDQNVEPFSLTSPFYKKQIDKDLRFNELKNGDWGTYIHLPLPEVKEKEVGQASSTILTVGDLSTMKWVEQVNPAENEAKSLVVQVFYSALNFKDVMIASGKLQCVQSDSPTAPDINLGIECSGITKDGKRVTGITRCEGMSLHVALDPGFTWECPDDWSLAEAATVPCVYATCYYALIVRGAIEPGESILIHAGSGGIGLAAISIALSLNCTIYTTVGTDEKKEFLLKRFPQLKGENIGSSRNTSFRKMILRNTKGKGVDLVLNSLSADLFQASLKCIAMHGRFLEIGKVDFSNGTLINTKMFLKNCSLHGVFLDELFDLQSNAKKSIQKLVEDGIKKGVVKPLPTTIFSDSEVENAMRFLSSGKHKGKVLIEIRNEKTHSKNQIKTIKAVPKVYFDPGKSFVVVGGLGGLGLELTDWLIKKGATKIVLNSRRKITTGYQSLCMKKWSRFKGVTVVGSTEDTTTLKGAQCLLDKAMELGPVGGIFNMALVLRDSLIENQTAEIYQEVFDPKIVSGSNLDAVSRGCCPQLEHFVVFSSIACGRGNAGQTNYAMANSALERLCEKRREEGLPGLAVQWGAVGEVGALEKIEVLDKFMEYLVSQNVSSILNSLETFMLQSTVLGSCAVLADKNNAQGSKANKTPAETVAHILGIRNIDLIDKKVTLSQLGLDSLMVAEIKQSLYRNYQLELSTEEIRDISFQFLIDMEDVDGDLTKASKDTSLTNGEARIQTLLSKEAVVSLKEYNSKKKNVFLIHPIEGNVNLLKNIAKEIDANVFGLECTKESTFDNLTNIARYFIDEMKAKHFKGPWNICGYSYGTSVAFEIGLQLEKNKETVSVISLDGSPLQVKEILKENYLRYGKTYEKSTETILKAFALGFVGNSFEIAQLLERADDWNKQLEAVSCFVSKELGLDAKDVALAADSYYKRAYAAYNYEPSGELQGKVCLIRRDAMDSYGITSNDYDLQKICRQKVDVLVVKGDHRSILQGAANTKIISEKISNCLL